MQREELSELIARQRQGWSLEQPFYTSVEVYEFERRGWLAEQWYVLAHASEIRDPGSFIVRDLLGESLILARDALGTLRGFYNVCRHRGSRICERDGRSATLVCPYHAWSYHLDGSLRAAAALPEGIDKAGLGLHAVPVREIGGIVFGSLKGDPRGLDALEREAAPLLAYHGIAGARIAARRSYPTHGNWKLVMENFLECYHCFPCHPEFCGVMQFVDVVARKPTPEAVRTWQESVERWFREEADPDSPVKIGAPQPPWAEMSAFAVSRGPIRAGWKTASQDGMPVAPLMGKQRRFDGGGTGLRFEPFIYLGAHNDYARLMQFLPIGAQETDVVITWLVDGSATAEQVDVDRMVWLWDVTTAQDKTIIERNAAGVRSRAYSPGPYSTLESWPRRLIARYLEELLPAI